jgi:penicillin-binding protein 1A
MTHPLTAGEPLARPASSSRKGGGARGGDGSGPQPPRRGPPEPARPPRRRRPFRLVARIFGVLFGLIAVVGIAGAVIGFGAYEKFSADLPNVDVLRHYNPPLMTRVYTGNARLLAELATERRIFVPIAAIPTLVRQAFISAEDQTFYTNPGVDPLAILRATVTDLANYGRGRRPIGASTITQQVAKNMLLNNSLSLGRKAREAILAWRIDHTLTKDRILEIYLNQIYLGLQSYGVAAAAQAYFNKSLDQLTLPEAAFLAALPKAPNNYNPFRFPDAARARRDFVLDRMAADHAITSAQADAARATPVEPAVFHRQRLVAGADYFTEEVRRRLIDRFGADQTTQGGLVVNTSLEPSLQRMADAALRDGLMEYDHAHGGWRGPVGHMAMTPALASGWPATLAQTSRPAGMLPQWRLGMVLSETDAAAEIGVLDAPPATGPGAAAPPPQGQMMTLRLASLRWARPAHDDTLGPEPHRLADVMVPGDIVMVSTDGAMLPAAPATAAGPAPGAPTAQLALEQIPQVEGALVSMDPRTGRVLAMSGGWSFDQSQFNRAIQAVRQPGSSFKPYVYLTAMEKGISPSQRFLNLPYVVNLGAAGKWRPHNDDGSVGGPVSLHVALAQSLNLVTIRVAAQLGMASVAKTAIAFHLVDKMPLVLPAALGAVGTTVLRQAAGYASFDMGGREVTPSLIDSVQDSTGKLLWRAPGLTCDGCENPAQPPSVVDQRKQIADPDSVYQAGSWKTAPACRSAPGSSGSWPARPARRTNSPMPGSSASAPIWSPPSGSASTTRPARSATTSSAPRSPARSGISSWPPPCPAGPTSNSSPRPASPSRAGIAARAPQPMRSSRTRCRAPRGRPATAGWRAPSAPIPRRSAATRRTRQESTPVWADSIRGRMSAESESLNEQIRQSVALLRRHL